MTPYPVLNDEDLLLELGLFETPDWLSEADGRDAVGAARPRPDPEILEVL